MTEALHHRHQRTTTYYVSGPMRGIPKFNFPMFDSCARWLRSRGWKAINPADHDREIDQFCEVKPGFATGDESLNDDPNMHFQKLLGWDLQQISAHDCDGIVMLPGWDRSSGATHERYVAEACGKQVWLAYPGPCVGEWYMTLCDDRLLTKHTAAGLRDALGMAAGAERLRASLSPTIHDPNHSLDREKLAASGFHETDKPNTFTRDLRHVRRGTAFAHDLSAAEIESLPLMHPAFDSPAPRDLELEKLLDEKMRVSQIGQFQTKDSGERVAFDSGMVRDTQDGKPRYDLIPLAPLQRLAELYARGSEKYGDRNWQKANSQDELERFLASAFRHFIQYLKGDRDEDHGIAVVWNIFAALWLEEQLSQVPSVMEND